MFTIGTDIIEIERVKKSIQNERFMVKVFGENELNEFRLKNFPPQSIAGAFAGKEAFAKALGTGICGFSLCEVEVLHLAGGKPYLHLSGNAEKLAQGKNFDISISHTDTLAMATVIAMGD